MSRQRRSAEPPLNRPLEFLFDRGMGKSVPEELQRRGWLVHRITDVFPDDAQQTPDEEWIEYGLVRGWVPLCKDGRIRGRSKEHNPLIVHGGILFHLDNQRLPIVEMVARFEANLRQIERAVSRGGPAIYAVSAATIRKTWP